MALSSTTADDFDYQSKTGGVSVPNVREVAMLSSRFALMRDAIGTISPRRDRRAACRHAAELRGEAMSEEAQKADPLQVFEDCGAAEMPIAETCMIAETTEEDFLANAEAVRRYRVGQLRTKLTIRQSVVKMAREGVPQMVKIYMDFVADNTAADLPGATGAADSAENGEFDGI